jgi:hypothetical protein
MSKKMAKSRVAGRAWLAATALCAAVLLGAAPASAQTDADEGFWIQVFALVGPQCPVVIEGVECPDGLLAGAELVLERKHHKSFEPVERFRTNASGYADLWVETKGTYRVSAPLTRLPRPFPRPELRVGPPWFAGPVTFRVPARHRAADGLRLTPVVVEFDSGIR